MRFNGDEEEEEAARGVSYMRCRQRAARMDGIDLISISCLIREDKAPDRPATQWFIVYASFPGENSGEQEYDLANPAFGVTSSPAPPPPPPPPPPTIHPQSAWLPQPVYPTPQEASL